VAGAAENHGTPPILGRVEKPLNGTVALVTGASSGIGAATARRLAAEGAAVALVARRGDRLDELASTLDGDPLVVVADVTQRAQALAAVERVVAELGRLDTVVNNAGVMLLGPALASPTEEWDRMIALNVQGSLHVTHAALPHLVRAGSVAPRECADLVFVSSTAGRVARPGGGVYSLTKFGIAAFAESLRQELIGKRARVSVVEPGTVDTELVTHLREDVRQAAESQVASIEALKPDDVADAIAYIVTRPRRVAVNELLVRAAEQTW
jgi:NADP-dependent 3-hydroxy acid dehydrogenase YdfG